MAWERLPIDPHPGPRPASEIVDARPLAEHVLIAGPETRTVGGALFAEAQMAAFLNEETLLVDIWGAPKAIGEGLAEAARRLGADLLVSVDVGGDVLGNGSEPGLASPLCDAVMLAATAAAETNGGGPDGLGGLRSLRTLGGVFGPCCDGELTVDEFLDRLAALSAAGALVGAAGLSPELARELEEATRQVPTEASAQAVRCARGETGTALIRRGRRTVPLSPLGAITFYFDASRAVSSVATLASAVGDASGLEEANNRLNALGLRTELDYERSFSEP